MSSIGMVISRIHGRSLQKMSNSAFGKSHVPPDFGVRKRQRIVVDSTIDPRLRDSQHVGGLLDS